MKKLLSIILMIMVLMASFSFTADALYNEYLENELYSECAILVCTDNNEVIFAKEPDKQTKPASLTKVVTALVVLDELKDLSEVYTVPQGCIDELMGTNSSLGGLKAGEQYAIYNLLCCLLVHSANDAATTLAYRITGDDRQAFVDKMNAKVEELGCTNSHFMNVHGLDDDDQYTSARDMSIIFAKAMENPVFAEIVAMPSYILPESNMQKERKIATTNFTILPGYKDYYCPNEIGGKTGTTSGAGHNLVSAATKNGYNYVCVAMGAPKEDFDNDYVDENGAFLDTKAMYDWAYDNLRLVSIASASKIVGEVKVKYGKSADHVTLCPSENSLGLMPKGVTADSLLIIVDEKSAPEVVNAPLKKGDYICKGEVMYADNSVAEIDLVASQDVKRSYFAYFIGELSTWVSSKAFKQGAVIVFVVLIAVVLLGYMVSAKNKKSKKKS